MSRRHGTGPVGVVVLHGGPGGAGEAEPLARELGARGHGVLEPFQTARSVDGQVGELRDRIEAEGVGAVAVVGWSWGAWLGALLAARYPASVRRLVLVGSGPFEEEGAATIRQTRAARLSDAERTELAGLRPGDGDPATVARFIELSDRAETFARDASPPPLVQYDEAIHLSAWSEAREMRRSGALLREISAIRCPVTAIHGDYDARPAEAVREPLLRILPSAKFVLIERCGHKPWQERQARAAFFAALESALG